MRRCPYCAEVIQDAAIVCKHCGRSLAPHDPDFENSGPGGGFLFGALVVVGILALVLLVIPGSRGYLTGEPRTLSASAYADAYVDVQDSLAATVDDLESYEQAAAAASRTAITKLEALQPPASLRQEHETRVQCLRLIVSAFDQASQGSDAEISRMTSGESREEAAACEAANREIRSHARD
jgi:hypothetical protein